MSCIPAAEFTLRKIEILVANKEDLESILWEYDMEGKYLYAMRDRIDDLYTKFIMGIYSPSEAKKFLLNIEKCEKITEPSQKEGDQVILLDEDDNSDQLSLDEDGQLSEDAQDTFYDYSTFDPDALDSDDIFHELWSPDDYDN